MTPVPGLGDDDYLVFAIIMTPVPGLGDDDYLVFAI